MPQLTYHEFSNLLDNNNNKITLLTVHNLKSENKYHCFLDYF